MARNVTTTVEGLTPSLEDMIFHDLSMSPNCCIFKTPILLLRHNEKAFFPDAFSIGPFHHVNPNLKATEKIKAKYLYELIRRSPCPLRDLINSIKAMEKEARECYAGPIYCSPDEFVNILVMDSCFIIELFRRHAYEKCREVPDPVFSVSCMVQVLWHDLILLENQVPWKVLEDLFNMTYDPTIDSKPLTHLAIEFFSNIFSSTNPVIVPHIPNIKHILDLFRKWLVLSTGGQEETRVGWESMPSATSLVEAGIKFKRGSSISILDIKFIDGVLDGVLEIPPLLIQETTETVFRNLISFEQCFPDCEARFTSYAILLDNLINTTKDMEILCQNKIIDNWLNPEDAAQFFNKLYHNAYIKKYYYLSLCEQVNGKDGFCHRSWPRWRAMLVRNYFNTPWAILSTSAAFILLFLSFVQTWFAVKS